MKFAGLSYPRVILLLSLWCVSISHAQQGRPNLITNGNFKAGMEGWSFSSAKKKGAVSMDDSQKHEGNAALKIENTEGDDSNCKQTVKVSPNTRYRFSAFVKTKDADGIKKGDNGGACIAVVGGYKKSKSLNGTKPWGKISFEFDTGRETELDVCMRLGFYSSAVTGTAWFSELMLVEVGKARR